MNDDLISRKALIEELESLKHIVDCNDNIELCITVVENAPTVEQPTGEWIETEWQTEIFDTLFKCSICEEQSIEVGNYCPWCGAKMKGGEGNVTKDNTQ